MPIEEPRGINRRLPLNLTANLLNRFIEGVAKGEMDDCWNWTRSFRNGYGAIKHEGRVHSAHRVAYHIANGDPGDAIITHTCDNRACCNPAHLIAGTPTSNVREMHARGVAGIVRGEMKPNAILNEQAVANIWTQRRTGLSASKIAEATGVKENQVKSVLKGRNWKHLMPNWAKS
jgi:hypothetical protein